MTTNTSNNSDSKIVLNVSGVSKRFGGLQALSEVGIQITRGQVYGLIGANGAGKTTTLKAIAGLLAPAAGTITYRGVAAAGARAFELVRQGLVLVPEGRGVFGQLTVAENLAMGAFIRDDAPGIAADLERMLALFPRLKERFGQSAGTLSGGEQQMLSIARALMSRPTLLLLDEPSMGLAPLIVEKIFETIADVARQGVTILLVEQNARLALQVCRRAYVMEGGTISMSGAARDLMDNPLVRTAYLGE